MKNRMTFFLFLLGFAQTSNLVFAAGGPLLQQNQMEYQEEEAEAEAIAETSEPAALEEDSKLLEENSLTESDISNIKWKVHSGNGNFLTLNTLAKKLILELTELKKLVEAKRIADRGLHNQSIFRESGMNHQQQIRETMLNAQALYVEGMFLRAKLNQELAYEKEMTLRTKKFKTLNSRLKVAAVIAPVAASLVFTVYLFAKYTWMPWTPAIYSLPDYKIIFIKGISSIVLNVLGVAHGVVPFISYKYSRSIDKAIDKLTNSASLALNKLKMEGAADSFLTSVQAELQGTEEVLELTHTQAQNSEAVEKSLIKKMGLSNECMAFLMKETK